MITEKTTHLLADIEQQLSALPLTPKVRTFLVGGCIRDALLGLPIKDLDVEVHNMPFQELVTFLRTLENCSVSVHGEFVVAQLKLDDGTDIEFSVPREEQQVAGGHKGFHVQEKPFAGVEFAVQRRDFTVNALMVDAWYVTNLVGAEESALRSWVEPECEAFLNDISRERVVLRPVGPAFEEDPLRVLRGMRFLSKVPNSVPSTELIQVAKRMHSTFDSLSKERVFGEFDSMFMNGSRFVAAFDFLSASSWIAHFPRLSAMAMTPQDPVWHPEGDVLRHTGHTLEAASSRRSMHNPTDGEFREIMWGLLVHDAWKPETFVIGDDNRIHNPAHDSEAGKHGAQWLRDQFDVPIKVARAAAKLAEVHMCHAGMTDTTNYQRAARRLAKKVDGLVTPMQIMEVIFADMQGRPPLSLDDATDTVWKVVQLTNAMMEVATDNEGKLTVKSLVTGGMIMAQGVPAGPEVGKIKNACMDAQIEGELTEDNAHEVMCKYINKFLT